MRDGTVPLTLSRWETVTETGCPVPPRWGVMTVADRRVLANAIESQSNPPAIPRASRIRRHARYQSKLMHRLGSDVPLFAGPEDEVLAASKGWS